MIASRQSPALIAVLAALSGGAHAAMVGVTATNYEVVDGSRRYSVMDIFMDCSGEFDKLVNFYGTSASNSFVRTARNGLMNSLTSSTAGNGAAFAQAGGSGWLPSASAASSAWDSFVTIGARSQADASASIDGDPMFLNKSASEPQVLLGSANSSGAYVGAGWFTSNPTGSHVFAGTYADKRIMLGRFSVDVTDLSASDVLTLRFKGNVSMKVNGVSAGGGTILQPSFDHTFTYGFVPAPGVSVLLGLAGLVGRRRKSDAARV